MLSEVMIMSKGGVVLWDKSLTGGVCDMTEGVNSLVAETLMKSGGTLQKSYDCGDRTFFWSIDSANGIVAVATTPKGVILNNIDRFLESVNTSYSAWASDKSIVDAHVQSHQGFSPQFQKLWETFEQLFIKKDAGNRPPQLQQNYKVSKKDTKKASNGKKKSRNWDDGAGYRHSASQDLDYSAAESSNASHGKDDIPRSWLAPQTSSNGLVDAGEYEGTSTALSNGSDGYAKQLNRWFGNISFGKRKLTSDELNPIIDRMREHLISKNVASETARNLAAAAKSALLGTEAAALTTVRAAVKSSLEEALTKLLNPSSSTDLLRDIVETNKSGKTFSIVFCGVNGVGKSTNLSKVCFWLLQNQKRVLIAACDTFRSGAVEQLKTHVRKLNAAFSPLSEDKPNIELFEQGYGKDAPIIAKNALTYANSNGFDVVLIDTAGRMQDNEPLMRSLAKLITINNPNRIFFVGEALVGNEAIDQLTKFNKALLDFSPFGKSEARVIDGIILTKFDTIDDKVGAAVSMAYVTGKPIVFVGTGQTYVDLKRLNIPSILSSLLR